MGVGVVVVCVCPESRTIAVDRPHANAERTESLQRKRAGTRYFSNRNSVSLSL